MIDPICSPHALNLSVLCVPQGLRRITDRVVEISDLGWNPKPDHVRYNIGQIFRHKKHGYRGVIVAWFPSCPLDDQWVAQWGPFENGTEQPFYQTMIDTKDRPNGLMTYAAQENLILLESDDSPPKHIQEGILTGVHHPLMQKLFKDEAPDAGQHIVHDHMAQEFTEDF